MRILHLIGEEMGQEGHSPGLFDGGDHLFQRGIGIGSLEEKGAFGVATVDPVEALVIVAVPDLRREERAVFRVTLEFPQQDHGGIEPLVRHGQVRVAGQPQLSAGLLHNLQPLLLLCDEICIGLQDTGAGEHLQIEVISQDLYGAAVESGGEFTTGDYMASEMLLDFTVCQLPVAADGIVVGEGETLKSQLFRLVQDFQGVLGTVRVEGVYMQVDHQTTPQQSFGPF